ncbi:MAG: dependent oxidoreductase [Jatrophihabitantaceae bacterium]|nr:dependent oxidoreductase [Jatrophihabitantaceae bacterium]
MKIVVVGAGPIGLFCGMALARRGHQVVLVDRDSGPAADGTWDRRGVMQFHHPHGFRPQVVDALVEELPDVLDAIVDAGGILVGIPGAPRSVRALQCRRSTLERAMRRAAAREPGLVLQAGHVDEFLTVGSRICGVLVDGRTVEADLVVCAAGRSAQIAGDGRVPAEGGSCGMAYVSRMYRALPGVEVPESAFPIGSVYDGYLAMVFPQDDRTISALIVRASSDAALADLRRTECYDAAVQHIPQLAPWTDPDRFAPITAVLPGGNLTNSYRSQLGADGSVPVAGLFFVGDSICTTNPAEGRGIALGLLQARHLLACLDDSRTFADISGALDAWCTDNIRPWYEDHVHRDAALLTRWAGKDIDIDAPISSDVVCDAAQLLPQIAPAAGMYNAMVALPDALMPHQEPTRALLRTGWRPPNAPGSCRSELIAAIGATS